MGENKGQTIFLSVIGIATLLVAIIGATFAYFTTQMKGDAANVSATSAKLGAVTFTADGVTADNTAILPGWTSGAKNVTVTLAKSDYDVTYSCTLDITANPFTDMKLTVGGDNAVAGATKILTTGTDSIKIAEGTLSKGNGDSKTTTYTLDFPETGKNQDPQQGQVFTATVKCATAGATVYYNSTHPEGITEEPKN